MKFCLLLLLPIVVSPAFAAGPQRGISLDVPSTVGNGLPVPPKPPGSPPQSRFQPAPTPNRDVDGPVAPRASNATTVAPSLFTRSDSYRGDGFAKGSTAQSEQERRVRPGAGLSLTVPFAPN